MPVTKGALLHQLVQRVEELERQVAALTARPRPRPAPPRPAEKK